MEMPNNCFDCPMSDYGSLERCALIDSIVEENARCKDCPALYVSEIAISLEEAKKGILTVYSKEYGSIEAVPVDYLVSISKTEVDT